MTTDAHGPSATKVAPIKGVVFDLDGVLVQTEPLCHEAWQRAIAPFGARLTTDQHRQMMGTSLDRCLAYVLQETGIPRSRAELSKDYWGHLWRLIDNGIEAIPGVKAILDYLYSCGYLLGVASNSPTSYIAKTTSQVEIAAYFSCMVGADAVGHPKPAPDVYLKAAAHLGLSPEECLAVEDTPSGVRSAISAGMRCILIPDPALPKRDGYGVDAVYPSLIDWHADLDHWLPREPTPKASSRSYQSRNKGACT